MVLKRAKDSYLVLQESRKNNRASSFFSTRNSISPNNSTTTTTNNNTNNNNDSNNYANHPSCDCCYWKAECINQLIDHEKIVPLPLPVPPLKSFLALSIKQHQRQRQRQLQFCFSILPQFCNPRKQQLQQQQQQQDKQQQQQDKHQHTERSEEDIPKKDNNHDFVDHKLARIAAVVDDGESYRNNNENTKDGGGGDCTLSKESNGAVTRLEHEHGHGHDHPHENRKNSTTHGGTTTNNMLHGVLKRSYIYVQAFMGVNKGFRKAFEPIYLDHHDHANCTVRFGPTIRVVQICKSHCMTKNEKSNIWWQNEDFTDFKTEISILANNTEEVTAAETWLLHKSIDNNTNNKNNNKNKKSSSIAPRSSGAVPVAGGVAKQSGWWHKYGDSRRGIEKFVSSKQARETFKNYKTTTNMVLAEQRRQKFWAYKNNVTDCIIHRHTTNNNNADDIDHEKIAQIYREYSSWARDLALAIAASDADAVITNFDDTRRKSREYFLLKQVFNSHGQIHKHMPTFMIPKGITPKGYLDEQANNVIL